MKSSTSWYLLLAVCSVFGSSCKECSCQCEAGQPSLSNREEWKSWLQVEEADPNEEIGTTQTQISNVSPDMAWAKMNQALESYDAGLGYRLSTVFEVAKWDEGESSLSGPAITDVVVNGHYYYIGLLDWRTDANNRAAYEQTNRIIPALVVVDAEDETKPAYIRTADAKGNPYKIVLYLGEQATVDEDNIYRYLRNNEYSTALSCNMIDNPTLEVDDDWRPYITTTYIRNDGCGLTVGDAYYPLKLLVIDIQTREIHAYDLDDPKTKDVDERASDIPEWVDQIYSPFVVLQWISYWGYNPDNHGKTSELDWFVADGDQLDMVMNAENTNLVFTAYITSKQRDTSVVSVMLVDPRTGKAKLYPMQGSERAMATKSAAVHVIKQATVLWGYAVEDLTLHTIYGVKTWEGVLTRPAIYNDGTEAGSLYAGTVLLEANYDLKPANVIWAKTKHEAFTKYEEHMFLRASSRVGSNVLERVEITGKVSDLDTIVIGGNTSKLLHLEGQPGKTWEVSIDYVGNPLTEQVLDLEIGDNVYMVYGDPHNRKTYIVREIRRLNN